MAQNLRRRQPHQHYRVTGVDKLHGAEHEVIPDRIEAATFGCRRCGCTNGEVIVSYVRGQSTCARCSIN